jgi:hypothetical protein
VPGGAAAVLEARVEPVEAVRGERVPVYGSSRLISGPDSPWQYLGYSLEYGSGTEPEAWQPAVEWRTHQVRSGVLGEWDTSGLALGRCTMRLSLAHNMGEPVRAEGSALVCPLNRPPDLDGDGRVNAADVGVLMSAFLSTDAGDLDGDGDTDADDLYLLLIHFPPWL